MTYTAKFERIGRRRDVPDLVVVADTADQMADAIWHYAKGFLGSKWYDVTVDLEAMRGSIEYGRFGRFTLEPVA